MASKRKPRKHRKRKLRQKPAQSRFVHRLEPLEQRILLTTLFGSEVFEYRAPVPGDPEGDGPVIRIAVEGDAVVEFIGADIDDENELVLADIPGTIIQSQLGRTGTKIGGGLGGLDGIVNIGETPIDDTSPTAVPNFIPIDITPGDEEDRDANHIRALASRDAAGNGETYGFNVTEVAFGETTSNVVQLLQLSNATGAAEVLTQLQKATLEEDVVSEIDLPVFVEFQAFAVDPTSGLAYALGRRADDPALDRVKTHLFRINRLTGSTTDLGILTNTDNGNEMQFVRAMDIDDTGQLFVLGDVTPNFPAPPDQLDMSLVAIDKTDATFGRENVTAVVDSAGVAITERYEAMSFHPDGRIFAILRGADADDAEFFDSQLHEIDVATAIALNHGQVQLANEEMFIGGITFAGLDAEDAPRLVGAQVGPERLVQIPLTAGDVLLMGPENSIARVFALGSFTEPGFNADLLFSSDGGDVIRGSANHLPVSEDTGDSTVVDVFAADFQPRIGNDTDDRLFFIADTDDDLDHVLFHIDVTAPHRSAIQATLTSIFGCFRCEVDAQPNIQSMAWDQTSDTTAILVAFDGSSGSLVEINPVDTDRNTEGPIVTLQENEVNSITGLAFPEDDPTQEEDFVVAVDGGAAELLRVDTFDGSAFLLGPLLDPDDPDSDPDLDTDGPVRGEDVQGLTFNPLLINPFTNRPGVLLGTDATSDELMKIDSRARIPTGNVFAIYVSQASPDSFIAIAEVPEPGDESEEDRDMIPFEGSIGELRVLDATTGDLILVGADDATGQLYIGAVTEDLGEGEDDNLIPLVRGLLDQQLGVRPAGLDDLPTRNEDLSAGIVIVESILEYFSTEDDFAERLLEFNVDLVGDLAISRDGTQIVAVDTDTQLGPSAITTPAPAQAGPSAPQIDPSLLNPNDFINSSSGNPVAFEVIEAWDQQDLGYPVTLTYSYSNLLDGTIGLSDDVLRAAVEEGFALWSRFAPLNFIEVADVGPLPDAPDMPYDVTDMPEVPLIRIGQHSLDGPLGVLAYAYTPDPKEEVTSGLAGDIHFDSGENWTPTFFLEVFVHELGHSLGLHHSTLVTSRVEDPNPLGPGPDGPPIMNPFYQGLYRGLGSSFLFEDDVDGMQALYGVGSGGVSAGADAGEQLIIIDPDTGKAMSSNTIRDAVTNVSLSGVQGLDFGDVDFDGTEELFSIMDVVDFIPSQDVGGDLGGNLDVQDLAISPGGIIFAVDDDGGTLRLLQVDRDANDAIQIVADLGDITDLNGNAVTGINAIAVDQSGVLVVVGERAAVDGPMDQELFSLGVITVDSGDPDVVANEVIATPLGTLTDETGIVTDPIKALEFATVGMDTVRFAVRDVAGTDNLIQIDDVGAVTEVDAIEVLGVPTDLVAMAFSPTAQEMIGIDRSGGAGNGRLVRIDLGLPQIQSVFITPAGTVPDALAGLASDDQNLFYSISDGEVNPNTILVSLGAQPVLGTLDTTTALFTGVATVGDGLIGGIVAMAFTPGAGSIATQQGLFVIDGSANRFEINAVTGAIVDTNGDMVGDLNDGVPITDDSGTETNGQVLSIGSFDVDRNGNAFGHDLFYGRLVDIDLTTGIAGVNTATSIGSLRPTVGAIAFDFANDEFLAIDNSTGSIVIELEAGARESAVLMRLLGTDSDSAVPQSIGSILLGGTVTGQVDIAGSVDTFYTGWLLTGDAPGMFEVLYVEGGPSEADNFRVAGDIRNLVTAGSIGTDGLDDDLSYITGFDLSVGGKVGQIRTFADFLGTVEIQNDGAIPNLNSLGILQKELEVRPLLNPVEGLQFQNGYLFEDDGLFFNDSFQTAQYIGSIRSGIAGADDVIRVNGAIDGLGGDAADYYALPLMAGETVQIQLFEQVTSLFAGFSGLLNIGVFDPDGRLVATDYTQIGTARQGQPFEFTPDRPGVHRLAIAPAGDFEFTDSVELDAEAPYVLLVDRQGDLGLGGLVALGNVFGSTAALSTVQVRRGDLGAVVAELGSLAFHPGTEFSTDIRVDQGNLRTLEANVIGELGDVADPEVEVPNGSVGLLRSTGGSLAVDFDVTPIGGDFQVIDAATELLGNLEANGGIGVIRAGTIPFGPILTSFELNRDGLGADGTIDLIDVSGDFGSLGIGGPAIDTGLGGNVRYIRVGGEVFQDPFLGGSDGTRTTHAPGTSVELRDDSGGRITFSPVGPALDGSVIIAPDGEIQAEQLPSLSISTYGIRGSGGVVVVNLESNGSIQISSDSLGSGQPVEISELVFTADGGGSVDVDLNNNAVFIGGENDLTVGVNGSAPVDIFDLQGGVFQSFSNPTGGELVNATIGGAQAIINDGAIGIAKQHTNAAVNGQLTGELSALPFPFLDQRTGFITGDTEVIRTNSAAGNIIVRGRLNQLVTNANRIDDDPALIEGIVAPVLSEGDGGFGFIQIGEGLLPSGTGNLADAGIFADGEIERVVNQGVGSDIRGDIASSQSIGSISLTDGAIIGSDIFVVEDKASTREFSVDITLPEVPDTFPNPEPEIGAITLRGVGGMLSTNVIAGDIGKTTIDDGFGMLNSFYAVLGEGFKDDVVVDGFGIRDVAFSGGASQGDILAKGRGEVLDPADFTSSVRLSESFEFDPFFHFPADLPQFSLNSFLGGSFLEADTVNRAGLIDNTIAEGSRDLDMVSAFQIRNSDPDERDTRFTFANSIKGVKTDDIIAGNTNVVALGDEPVNPVVITTGSLGFFKPGSDVLNTALTVAGSIKTIRIRGDLANNSTITAAGPSGDIRNMRVDGDFDGELIVSGIVSSIDVRQDFTGTIMIEGQNARRLALSRFKLSGSFQGAMDVNGDVGTIEARDNLGGADLLETNAIRITGDLRALKVGTDRTIDGSQLGLEVLVLGDLGVVDVTGQITDDIIVDGTLSRFNLKADAITSNTDILTGSVTAFGEIRSTNITGGNIGNDVNFFAGQNIGRFNLSGGNINAGAVIGTAFGDMTSVTIRTDRAGMGGDLFGSLTAVNGTIRSVTVLGSDLGDGVNPAQIRAQNIQKVKIEGDMAANSLIDAVFDLGSLLIGQDILVGATVDADTAKTVKVGRDMLGAIALGAAVRSTSVQVDRNLGGTLDIAGNTKLTAKGDVTQNARISIGRNLEQLTVGDTLSGHLLVDGVGGKWRADSVTNAVITTAFGLDKMTVSNAVNNLLLQVGISRGGDDQFATVVANKEFEEAARVSELGKMTVATITDSVIASAGGVGTFQSGTMTNTSVSSGISLGSVAISQVLADTTPLADEVERQNARTGLDRELLHGNFDMARVGGAGMINSDFTAGVDAGPDGIIGNADDQVIIPSSTAPLPSGGGFSMFGTVTAVTNATSDIVADSGISKNNVTGAGNVVANVGYDVIADLNGPDPMVNTLLGTADEDNPVTVNVGITAQGPIEVTFAVNGQGFIDVFDDTPADDTIDSIVIRGTDARSRIVTTTTQPGLVDIRRVLTEDDNQFKSFSFDANLTGDGPGNNTADVWIDGGLDTFEFVDLADDLAGQVGGDVKELTFSTLGDGFLRVTGVVTQMTLDDGNGGRLNTVPVPAIVNQISALSIDNTGRNHVVNSVGGVGGDTPQILEVDPTVDNSIINGPFDVVDAFTGDTVAVFGMDFADSGDLFAVGSVRNPNPTEFLGTIGLPAQVLQLRGLAVNDQNQAFAVDSASGQDTLFQIDPETGAGTAVGVLTDIFSNTFNGNFLGLAFDDVGRLIGLVDDQDGAGGAFDTTSGVTLVQIETVADDDGFALAHRIGSDAQPGLFLNDGGDVSTSNGVLPDPDLDFRGLAVDAAGTIFTVRRDIVAGTDELISFDATGVVSSHGAIQVGAANTNIRGMGFFNGTLIGFDNDGIAAQLVVINLEDPGDSQNLGAPSVLDPALDDFTIGQNSFQAFAYDTDPASAQWFASADGQIAALGTIETASGQFTQRLPLAQDDSGALLAAVSDSTTIDSDDVPRTITDVSTIMSTLNVTGLAGTITDVNLTLNITHDFVSNLEATLISPTGSQIPLFSNVGGSGENFVNTTFDDEASTSITPSATSPFTDAFQPRGFLGVVDGEDPNGVWTLQIEDQVASNSGTLNNWSLKIATDVPVAPQRVLDIAVDNFDTGNVFVSTNDFRLFEYDTNGNLLNSGAVGTFTNVANNTTVRMESIDFNDTTGNFQGIDGQFNRLVQIDKANADIEALTDSALTPEVDYIAFDTVAGIFRGFFDDPNDVTDGFVDVIDTEQQFLRGVQAEQINRLTVTGDGIGVFSSRIATTGQSIGTVDVTGDFVGDLVTTGSVSSFNLRDGDFGGKLVVGTNASRITIDNGDVTSSGVFQIQENLDSFQQTGATFDGQILADTANRIRIGGDVGTMANIEVNDNAADLTLDGSFNGSMNVGAVSSGVTVGGLFDQSATLMSDFDIKSLSLNGGTELGSVVNLMGGAGSVRVGGVHRGAISTRAGVDLATLAAVDRGLVDIGQDIGSLSVTGNSIGGVFAAGTWVGPDNIYNTSDDIIFGGSVGRATFGGDYVDTILAAGVLPNLVHGGDDNNVQNNLPADNRVYVGSTQASQDLNAADSAEAGGILPSSVGRVSIRGDIRSTGSAVSGATASIVAVDAMDSVSGGRTTNLAGLVQRLSVPGGPVGTLLADRFDPVSVVSIRQVTNAEIEIVFSEPVISSSLILSEDNDEDGLLISPTDTPGSITLDDGAGTIIDDVTLQYAVGVDQSTGQEQGVLRILRPEGFEGRVDVTLSGTLVEQEGFDQTPVILDRSGLRSVLRDFNQDGMKDTGNNMNDRGEDLGGSILDGDGNGFEGGDYMATILVDDAPNSFTEALAEDPLAIFVDDGGLTVTNALDDRQDIDIYRITADAFQFLSVDFEGEADVQMAVFVRDPNPVPGFDESTNSNLQTFEMITRWETNVAEIGSGLGEEDLFMAFELRPTEDPDAVGGFDNDDLDYFVLVAPSVFGDFDTGATYQINLALASTDTALGMLPTNETIAYISNTLNENNNEQGFISPSQLVYLDFDGGTSREIRPNQFVKAFNAGEVHPQLDGLDSVLIEGSTNFQGSVVTGIVDNIMNIFQNVPTTHPGGVLNVQRFVSAELQALNSNIDNLPKGLIFTTVDPSLFGFDADTEFTTLFIGQLDTAPGLFAEASVIDFANESKGDEAIVFAQNFSILDPGSLQLPDLLNTFSTSISGTTAHELGHTLGSNHTERSVVVDDPNNEGVLDDSFIAGELNLMSGGPTNIFPDDFLLPGVLGTAPVAVGEFPQIGEFELPTDSEAFTDTLSDYLFWLS